MTARSRRSRGGRGAARLELLARVTDQVDREDVRADRGRERREVLALERAAEDQVHGLVGVCGERAQGGGHVGRLGVVDVADAVHLAGGLEPVRNAGERPERLRDRVVADAGGARRGGRGSRVLAVVGAAEQRLGRQRVVAPRTRCPSSPTPRGTTATPARSKMRSFAAR